MITVISLQDVIVAGGPGHYIPIKANVKTAIPDVLFKSATAAGCALVGDKPAPVAKSGRQSLIDCVTELLDADDDPDHFKVDGSPKLSVVKKAMGGADVSQHDLYDVYTKIILDRKLNPDPDATE